MNDNITFPDIPTITATATHMISIPTPTEIKMIFLFMMEVCSLCFPIRTDNKMTCGGFMIEVLSSCKGRFIIVHFYSPKSVLEMTLIFSHQICQSWHPQTPGNVDRRQRATPSAVSQAPRVRPSFRPRLQQVDGQHTGGDAQAVGDGGEWNGIIDIISWSDLFYDVAHYQ